MSFAAAETRVVVRLLDDGPATHTLFGFFAIARNEIHLSSETRIGKNGLHLFVAVGEPASQFSMVHERGLGVKLGEERSRIGSVFKRKRVEGDGRQKEHLVQMA